MRQPCLALVEAVTTEFARRDLPLTGDPKRSLFRINRDVRFSKDKSPYKIHAGVVWMRPGFKKESAGVAYLHVADEGCFFGGGFWEVERRQLDAIREDIRSNPAAFTATLDAAAVAGLVLDTGDSMTRLPRGFEDVSDPAILPAIKARRLVVKAPLLKRDVGSATLVARIVAATEAMLPFLRFGWDAVAEAGPPPDWSLLDHG